MTSQQTTTRRRPRDRKQRIVAAAAELFAQRGFASVGIDDIGTAVGVGGSAIYRHFKGKDALLLEVVLSNMEQIADGLSAAREAAVEAEELIRRGISVVLDRSAGLSTAIREFRRLIALGAVAEVAPTQRRVDRYWRDILRRVNPELDRTGVAIRMAALNGPTIGVALGPQVARPRLDDLAVDSLLGIMRAPLLPAVAAESRPRWQPKVGRRDQILDAAVRLFAARGYTDVSVQDIGESAGISGPTIYHYYESKSELLVDACDVALQRVAVSVDHALRAATSAADALERLVLAYVTVVFDDVDLIRVLELESDALPESELPRISRRRTTIEERWTEVLTEVRPDLTESEARLLVFMVFPLINFAITTSGAGPERLADITSVAIGHLTNHQRPER